MVSVNKHEKLYEYISLVIFYLFVFFSVLNLYIISTIEMEYQLLYTTVVELKQIVFSNKIFSHQQYILFPPILFPISHQCSNNSFLTLALGCLCRIYEEARNTIKLAR